MITHRRGNAPAASGTTEDERIARTKCRRVGWTEQQRRGQWKATAISVIRLMQFIKQNFDPCQEMIFCFLLGEPFLASGARAPPRHAPKEQSTHTGAWGIHAITRTGAPTSLEGKLVFYHAPIHSLLGQGLFSLFAEAPTPPSRTLIKASVFVLPTRACSAGRVPGRTRSRSFRAGGGIRTASHSVFPKA